MLLIRNSLTRFVNPRTRSITFLKKLKGRSLEELELFDINRLEKIIPIAYSLNDLPIAFEHPLHSTAKSINAFISSRNTLPCDSVVEFAADTEAHIKSEFVRVHALCANESSADELKQHEQTAIRLLLLHKYISNLKAKLSVKEIIIPDDAKMTTIHILVDSILRGSSAERVTAHLRLYGKEMSPWQLQNCFYTLFNAELDAIYSYWLKDLGSYFPTPAAIVPAGSLPASTEPPLSETDQKLAVKLDKEHRKKIAAFKKDYLLDKLEVNVKSRCVFAWTDAKFQGFKPVEESQIASVEDIVVSRRLFFPEALTISKQFITDYVGLRRTHYNDKREFRKNLKLGSLFFLGTCILDAIVCNI